MKDSTKVLLGFAAGVATAASLYALAKTEKGQEIVHDLERRTDGLKKGMGDLVEKGKHMAEDLAKKFNGAARETSNV
jgi:hypothetical protein